MSDNEDTKRRYLDLLRHTLTGYIHIDHDLANLRPPDWTTKQSLRHRVFRRAIVGVLKPFGLVPMRRPKKDRRSRRELGQDWPVAGETMIGLRRLEQLQEAMETVLKEGIPGDLLEAGVWRGGAAILMQAVLAVNDACDRHIWVCDSFQGLPPPDPKNPADTGDRHHTLAFLAVSQEQVRSNFDKYGLLGPNVRFIEGFFENTLPGLSVERLALLRLDGDMYGSTICILESLYDKVSPGGFVIVDDFNLSNCVRAVSDFREQRQITEQVIDIDGSGVYWRKLD